jgi:hypothetical protein
MACALSESIFCWPRGCFLFEECFVDAVCVLPVDFVVLADVAEVLCCLWVFVVAGFLAGVSSVELERAPAAATQANTPSVISARNRAPRDCDETLNRENLYFQKIAGPAAKNEKPG